MRFAFTAASLFYFLGLGLFVFFALRFLCVLCFLRSTLGNLLAMHGIGSEDFGTRLYCGPALSFGGLRPSLVGFGPYWPAQLLVTSSNCQFTQTCEETLHYAYTTTNKVHTLI